MADAPRDDARDELAALREENAGLRDRLRDAERLGAVGTLAASVTHEFNNILTTTINYARMGLRHTDDATREKAFNRILAAGQRAAKISAGMLSFAHGGSDRRELADLAGLAGDVLLLVEKDLQSHRVSHQIDLAGRPHAEVCVSQVQQVLVNLILNARQAMGGGGRLVITARDDVAAGTAELSVADTGPGIPEESLPRIFEPFYSTKERDSAGSGGTGLGLGLCRDIVQAHGGRIRVESAPGRGTTFTLRFPRREAPVRMAG